MRRHLYQEKHTSKFQNIIKNKDRYIHTDNDGDYYLEAVGNTIFIYFEESDSWCDWMSNFNFWATSTEFLKLPQVSYNGSNEPWKCHKGFLRVWKFMKKQIEQKVEQLLVERRTMHLSHIDEPEKYPLIKNIICAGYSHGGPLCGLCVEDMTYLFKEQYDLNIYGYAFGCPRFIWGKLPDSVKERFANFQAIRLGKDIVTHVPPRIFGYSHGPNGIMKIKPKNKHGCIDAHRPSSYLSELYNLYFIEET